MSMRVIVTGGFGYLGSALVQKLLDDDVDVVVLDVGYFGVPQWVAGRAGQLKCLRLNVRDSVEVIDESFDAVFHLAAISNDPVGRMSESAVYDPSLLFSRKLADACLMHGVHLVFPSSCSVYGAQTVPVSESSQPNPLTGYSRNKLQIEKELLNKVKQGLSLSVFRLATVYGWSPNMRFDTVINMLVGMAHVFGKIDLNSDGSAFRPFIHIDDAVEVFLATLLNGGQENGPRQLVLNVGSDEANSSIRDVAKVVSEVFRVPVNPASLTEENASEDKSLFFDRKTQGGRDARSYVVKFDSLRLSGLPYPSTTLKDGISSTAEEATRMGLSEMHFKDISRYRLQQLEYLLGVGMLDDSLSLATK